MAFRAPKQERETMTARKKEPRGPKTTEPKCTAMVFVEAMVEGGRTKM